VISWEYHGDTTGYTGIMNGTCEILSQPANISGECSGKMEKCGHFSPTNDGCKV